MAFSEYALKHTAPLIPPPDAEQTVKDALRNAVPGSWRFDLAWNAGRPWLYPAADGSGRWDVHLGPIWTLGGKGESVVRAALGDAFGCVLGDDLRDYRIFAEPDVVIAERGLNVDVEVFLYTADDIDEAIALRDRKFVIVQREAAFVGAHSLEWFDEEGLRSEHKLYPRRASKIINGCLGFKAPEFHGVGRIESLYAVGLLRAVP